MKRSRLTTGAAGIITLVFAGALAGCSPTAEQEPPVNIPPSESSSSAPAEETVPADPYKAALEERLTGATLVGEFGSEAVDDRSLEFTFAEDGTLDFADFGGEIRDNPGDVWSVDATHITLTFSQIPEMGMTSGGAMEERLVDYRWSAPHSNYQEDETGQAVDEEMFVEAVTEALASEEGLLWSTQSDVSGQIDLDVRLQE